MKPAILILGALSDQHVKCVAQKLRERHVECYILSHDEEIPHFTISNRGEIVEVCLDKKIFQPSVIWNRIKVVPLIYSTKRDALRQFTCECEWVALYQNLCYVYDGLVINSIYSKYRCNRKMNQHIVASTLGFNTPETTISNDRGALLGLLSKGNREYIIKPIGFHLQPHPSSESSDHLTYSHILTSTICKENIIGKELDGIKQCPNMIQKKIEKQYELRVICTLYDALAFRIESNEKSYSKVDWRWGTGTLNFTQMECPLELKNFCLAFLNEMRLFYGVFDFAVDENGDYWFFECNPDGQWLWLDVIADGEISDIITNLLVKHALRDSKCVSL